MPMDTSEAERSYYSRQLSLKSVGEIGQSKLKRSSVLIVGAGGLGCPALQYLTGAGVGRIGIIDNDKVDISNLHRQILFTVDDIGYSKAQAAARRASQLNPHITIQPIEKRLDATNVEETFAGYDLIIDGTDNFASKYLINDACTLAGKPWISAAVENFGGQVFLFANRKTACYRCVFPTPTPAELAPSCAEAGILGITPGLTGIYQATEAIKWLLALGNTLEGRMLLFDALNLTQKTLSLTRDPNCLVCGKAPKITDIRASQKWLETHFIDACLTRMTTNMAAHEVQKALEHGSLTCIDVRSAIEFSAGAIKGAINVPLDQLAFADSLEKLRSASKTTEIILICQKGTRSAKAALLLQNHQIEAKSLSGGYEMLKAKAPV